MKPIIYKIYIYPDFANSAQLSYETDPESQWISGSVLCLCFLVVFLSLSLSLADVLFLCVAK